MNENEQTDSKATPPESNEPTAPAEAVKAHDFKGDARKAATGVKRLWNDLRRHDYKSEIRETFAKAKKDPSSLWKKPETPRPGKDLAIAGLAVAVAGLFLLLVTSGAFIGFVCLALGLVALFAGVLGFATEGRSLAFAGAGAGILAVLMSIAQIHAATRKPDPRDELIRILSAQLARESDQSVSQKDVADLLMRLEAAKSGKSEQSAEDLADAVSKLQSLTSTLNGGAAEAVESGLGQLLAGGSIPGGGTAAGVVASGLGQLLAGGSRPTGGGGDSFEATRARVAADPSLTVPVLNLPGLAPRSPTGELLPQAADSTQNDSSAAQRPFVKIPNAFGEESAGRTGGKNKDKFGHGFRTQDEDPPAGPSAARNKEVQQVLKNAKIETMTVDLPNKVGLLLTKLPDGSFMGTFEVTQDQWLSVMGGENPSGEDNVGDDHPVDSVWPADCLTFVEKLNDFPAVREAGLKFRIPSEEEWEKACLAGNKKSRDFGLRLDGAKVTKKTFGEIAWCRDNFTRPSSLDPEEGSLGISHSVGRKQPNAFGLYDMHGNVAELTFAKNSAVASSRGTRFVSKGGYWSDDSDSCEAYKTGRTGVMEEPPEHYSGAKQPTNYTLGFRVAASVLDKDIARILAAAEKVVADGGAAFFGFYPGMPEEDATKLAGHYGLALGDDPKEAALKQPHRSYNDPQDVPGHCQFVVDPVTKNAIQIRFNLSAILLLTKETDCKFDFTKLCNAMAKYVGELECIQDGNVKKVVAGKIIQESASIIYQRKTSEGTVVSLEKTPTVGLIHLTIEDAAAMASLAAAKMAAANNARIEAVEPVLNNAGIKTKTIELPGGVKLLLTLLPNERYLGTFEVTQAQFFSLMGTNVSQCVGADLPVDSVSVRDCLDFIAKANELPAVKEENLRFRLPSLADWEEACRAGTEGDYTKRLDGTEVDKNSISVMTKPSDAGKTAEHGPHPVGVAMPNAYGLYDMFGNVSEWVGDKVMDNPHHADSHYHMGGSWSRTEIKPIVADVQHRNYYEFDDPSKPRSAASLGFRVSVVSWPREIQRAKDEAAKAYALSNNGRIDAVKPVLEKAGIETKEIELPGGVRMLLNKTPDGSWAAAFEVTQAQWVSLIHDNPSSFQGEPFSTDDIVLEIWRSWGDKNPEKLCGTGLPVDQVSPGDVRTFFVLLNALPSVLEAGLTFHVPTQDEWLYVARAGSRSTFAKPLGGGDVSVSLMGWHEGNVAEDKKAPKHLQIVGQKQPNAFGLYDVHGNVAEFAEDRGHGHGSAGFYKMGGSIGPGDGLKNPESNIILMGSFYKRGEQPRFTGFRVVATEGGIRHLFDPEMTTASNARIDAVKPALDAKGIETKVFDLPGGVKLLLNKLPGGLWAGTFEVTQAQFLSIFGENPTVLYQTGDRPADGVSHGSADAFMKALNDLPFAKESGLEFRLPTCMEWIDFCGFQLNEYSFEEWLKRDDPMALHRTILKEYVQIFLDLEWDRRFSSINLDSRMLDDIGWFYEDKSRDEEKLDPPQPHPVGGKRPNVYGLYDMFGNVLEWTGTRSFAREKERKRSGPLPGDRTDALGRIIANPEYFTSGGSYHTSDYHAWGFRVDAPSHGCAGFRVWAQSVDASDPEKSSVALSKPGSSDAMAALAAIPVTVEGFGRIYMMVSQKPADTSLVVETLKGARVPLLRQPSGAWTVPKKKSEKRDTTTPVHVDSVAKQFVADSNARIDAVKPVLDEAGIETKEIELPGGARILMNKLPNGAWMAAFETTQAQFVSVFGRNPSRKISKGGDRAVENVSWNAATVYVSVLNRLPSVKESGLHFRLPSSTEWEYACRGGGGIAPLGKPLDKGKGKLDDMGWYDKNSDIEGVPQTHRVGQLQPNAFGLYDMIGNVAEWTATAYSQRALGDHTIGSRRIWRGGSWISPKERCTAAWRGLLPSDAVRPDTGFRLYATEDGSDPKDETVVFRDKEYKDASKPGPLPDDRTAEQKLIGAFLDLQTEMQKAEIRLQVEEARFELELMGIDPDTLF